MATVQESFPTQRAAILPRPKSTTGFWSWVTTVDHKRIGIMYAVTAIFFFLVGGIEALIIRLQLFSPDMNVVSADVFNQLFTMHGTTMVFLAVMPLSAAFFNYLLPLMLGARDVAFPRLNAFSYWLFLFGGIFINTGWFVNAAPDGGLVWLRQPDLPRLHPGVGDGFLEHRSSDPGDRHAGLRRSTLSSPSSTCGRPA